MPFLKRRAICKEFVCHVQHRERSLRPFAENTRNLVSCTDDCSHNNMLATNRLEESSETPTLTSKARFHSATTYHRHFSNLHHSSCNACYPDSGGKPAPSPLNRDTDKSQQLGYSTQYSRMVVPDSPLTVLQRSIVEQHRTNMQQVSVSLRSVSPSGICYAVLRCFTLCCALALQLMRQAALAGPCPGPAASPPQCAHILSN